MTSITSITQKQEIVNFLSKICLPNEVHELRIIAGSRIHSGYFDDLQAMAKAAQRYNEKGHVYFSVNPCSPALLARAKNKVRENVKSGGTTTDSDIAKRTTLYLDIDPKKPSGISSSEEEHEEALNRAAMLKTFLEDRGWPQGILFDSGNGAGIFYRIDLANDDESRTLIQNLLKFFDMTFSDDKVKIDLSVFNAARIARVPGTMNCKGENLPERPHRKAEFLIAPEKHLQPVTREQLEAQAALFPEAVQPERKYSGDAFDIEEFIKKHNITVYRQKSFGGGTLYEVDCIRDTNHSRASIGTLTGGALFYRCFHNSCQDHTWSDYREKFEPGYRDQQRTTASKNGKLPSVPEIIQMSSIEPEEVSWLLPNLIPDRKITLMEGNPGDGKTWAMLYIAAAISAGFPLPNPKTGEPEIQVTPGDVLYMSAEDGPADTLRPRLDKAKADPEKVFLLTGSRDETGKLNGVTLADVEVIEKALEQVKPKLLVVDPLQGYLGANVDMHRANETRPLLAELGKLAEKYGCAVVCIRHLTKANTSKAIFRGMGSIDFSAAARSILLVGCDPEKPEKRAIIQTKNSLEEMAPAIGFEIKEGSFYWTGTSDLTSARVFQEEPDDSDRSALDDAEEFLQGSLADGPVESETLLKEGKKQGISEASLRRAKKIMEIKARKLKGKGQDAPWVWELEQDDQG